MKKKNPKPLNRTTGDRPKKPVKQNIDMKYVWLGVAALVVTAVITVGLIRYYGDSTVARINGINIRESEIVQELNANEQIRALVGDGAITMTDASEFAAQQVGFSKLFEDYARRHNIPISDNMDSRVMMQTVADAIIADPALFAHFEQYMEEDDFPLAKARAEGILERALAGEDFDELVATYSEDGMPPEGYTFVVGAMVIEFCEATRALEIGEISGLVQTQFGFHIIKRVEPPNPDNVMRPWDQEPPADDEEEELLGAKHILITATERSLVAMQNEAVFAGFNTKLENADLELLRGLGNISLP